MKARAILFSGSMIRALLAGSKTQTRRLVKPQPDWLLEVRSTRVSGPFIWPIGAYGQQCGAPITKLPYGVPGDLLIVREAFSYETLDVDRNGFMPPWYWADGDPSSGDFTRPKPSIHMPRWASRLTLEITEVRIERLQDISEADAKAEGCMRAMLLGDLMLGRDPLMVGTYQLGYANLWDEINGDGAWDANPYVWAVSFIVHHQNIDAFLAGREAQ